MSLGQRNRNRKIDSNFLTFNNKGYLTTYNKYSICFKPAMKAQFFNQFAYRLLYRL